MPNCDFYGTPDYHTALLNWLFDQGACHVYELYSDFELPLKRFSTSAEVLRQFDRCHSNGEKWHKVHLQLHVHAAGPPLVPALVTLNPRKCDGATFRYAAKGLGLVQLYLGGFSPTGELNSSHTNHFTQARAEAAAEIAADLPPAKEWDFKKIASFSYRFNREIRKRGAAKLGSRPMLPGAFELQQAGVPLLP